MTFFDEMMKKAASADGFLAALDQSGGSTPKALTAYGVPADVSIFLLTMTVVIRFGHEDARWLIENIISTRTI